MALSAVAQVRGRVGGGGMRGGGGVRVPTVRPGGIPRMPVSPVIGRRGGVFVSPGRFATPNHFRVNTHFFFGNRPFFSSCIHGAFFGGFPCRRFFFGNQFLFAYVPFSYPIGGLYPSPYYDYPSYSAPPPPPAPVVDDSATRELSQQVQELNEQIADLREQQARAQQPKAESRAQQPSVPTVLIFKDGHQVTTMNYAIVGASLWILNERAAKKVPLADLDLRATQQANDANGVEFHVPKSATSK